MEVFVYTNEEFEKMLENGNPFIFQMNVKLEIFFPTNESVLGPHNFNND
ncbi:MAG: hypothetical protein ACTSUT_04905 [Promethearchaeota archaeon]